MKVIGKRAGRIAVATGLLSAVAVTVGGVAADSASAAGCYDSKKFFDKPGGNYSAPTGNGWFRTTSNCRDINLQSAMWVKDGAYVKVCFRTAGCQDSWKWVPAGGAGWKVIASDVKDGTDYRFRFLSVGAFQGYRAN